MIAAYVESLKLRIGTFIAMAAALGYLATVPSAPSSAALALLFVTMLAASAGSGALNHYLDRDLDGLMRRTARRPLPSGRIAHPCHVVALGVGLVAMGIALALWTLHPLVALHVFLGAFTYVVVYTIWLKRRSWLSVVVGGLAGSFAVLGGGSAARAELCLPPVIFAVVLFFWSPTHFWSLGIAYKDEYAGARIPMLSVVKGEAPAARAILWHAAALVLTAALPVALGLLGAVYATITAAGGLYLLACAIRLVGSPGDRGRALHAFHASNLWLLLVFVGVLAEVLRR